MNINLDLLSCTYFYLFGFLEISRFQCLSWTACFIIPKWLSLSCLRSKENLAAFCFLTTCLLNFMLLRIPNLCVGYCFVLVEEYLSYYIGSCQYFTWYCCVLNHTRENGYGHLNPNNFVVCVECSKTHLYWQHHGLVIFIMLIKLEMDCSYLWLLGWL